ncbi:TOBE domain-containing protein [Lysobacter arenosi]|uniref:TOBE domain-containing protein n=1 Tax=Lysobacter arenosi TaxID=2795387 RepID=A0ABX7RBZ7_9GAMM|nr:TOBE domain-containing protein [Lysobacter arenosi]QSX75250.1 TOBE domain-containing protein [Lysobacter arenosi]
MTDSSFRINSALTVEARRGPFGGRRWMALLAALGDAESITAAAKDVGLSYKAAWDAIDAMNNLSDQPLVERAVGGKGGGGTRLTDHGRRLVAAYQAVEEENERFIERLNARMSGAAAELETIGRLAMLTSARNHFAGKVVRIATGAVNDEVELELSGGARIVAIITHESLQHMALAVGDSAVALVKASSVIVATGADVKLSARNRLQGKVARVQPGAVNAEVVIDLGGGNSVAAIITNTSALALQLAEGVEAAAIFKASGVILAVGA